MENFVILVFMLGIQFSWQKCNTTNEIVFNLHGQTLLPATVMPVTVCNASDLNNKQPLQLDSYEEYFKVQGHFVIDKDSERVPHLYPNRFTLLPKLKTLIISQVALETIESFAFAGLKELRFLDLHTNNLRKLPVGLFDELTSLVALNLEDNKLEAIDGDQFNKLSNLKELRLTTNRIKALPDGWTKGLPNLEYLNIAHNQLQLLRTGTFSELGKLDRLRLHNNKLGVIEKNAFKGLWKLDSMTIERNVNITCDLDFELAKLPFLSGISLSPNNFNCLTYELARSTLNERKIEYVEIPYDSQCIS